MLKGWSWRECLVESKKLVCCFEPVFLLKNSIEVALGSYYLGNVESSPFLVMLNWVCRLSND